MRKQDYGEQIQEIIEMMESKDADGIDRHLYRYEDKGLGMLFIALYHALKIQNSVHGDGPLPGPQAETGEE